MSGSMGAAADVDPPGVWVALASPDALRSPAFRGVPELGIPALSGHEVAGRTVSARKQHHMCEPVLRQRFRPVTHDRHQCPRLHADRHPSQTVQQFLHDPSHRDAPQRIRNGNSGRHFHRAGVHGRYSCQFHVHAGRHRRSRPINDVLGNGQGWCDRGQVVECSVQQRGRDAGRRLEHRQCQRGSINPAPTPSVSI